MVDFASRPRPMLDKLFASLLLDMIMAAGGDRTLGERKEARR